MRRTLAGVLGASMLCAPLAAPQATDAPPITLHAETRVVQIDVTVKDSHSRAITNLTKQDFAVSDNGKQRAIDIFSFNGGESEHPQAIPSATPTPVLPGGAPKVFSNRTAGPPDLPRHSTVIVMDQVNSFFDDAAYGRQQVLKLLAGLKADERVAIYAIVRKTGLVMIQDYTTDHALLTKSLSKWLPKWMMPRPPEWPVGIQDAPRGHPPDSGKSMTQREDEFIWQSNSETARLSLKTLAEQLAHVPGRKNVYWVTQAFPARILQGMGQAAWDKTLTALNEANIAVNTVDTRGLYGGNPSTGTLAAMQQVAERTGGTAYFGRNDMDAAMAEGIEGARASYTLGFYLGDSERDNTFHELKVKALTKGLQLFYRQGYYAGSTELPPDGKGSKDDMDSVLLSQVNSQGVGLAARVEISREGADSDTRRGTVNLILSLEPASLSLKEQGSTGNGKVEETVVEQNESGNTLVRMNDTKQFQISDKNRADFNKKGLSWPFPIPLLDGATKITIIVRDTLSGRIGSLVVPLQ